MRTVFFFGVLFLATLVSQAKSEGITILPKNMRLVQGAIQTFTAMDIESAVWTVSGNISAGTKISNEGRLTIAKDETARELTVKAKSAKDNTVFGTATVSVYPAQIAPLTAARFRTQSWHNSGGDALSPRAIIDGDVQTFWHSNYGGGSGSAERAPYFADIDLGEVRLVTGIELNKRENVAGRHIISAADVWIHPEEGDIYPNGERVADYFGSASQSAIDSDFAMTGWVPLENVSKDGFSTRNILAQKVTLTFAEPVATRYVRVQVTNRDSNGLDFIGLSKLVVMGYGEPYVSIELQGNAEPPKNALSLWYRKPATVNAMNQNNDRLPIGNGRMGAMVTGSVLNEQLQFNEETLFSGGPGGTEVDKDGNRGDAILNTFNFGYSRETPNLDAIYNRLMSATSGDAGGVNTAQISGNFVGYGQYKNFGWLELDYKFPVSVDGATIVNNYRRELDLEDGIARVVYETGGINFTREYIASYPHNIIAVRISADRQGAVNLGVSATPGQTDHRTYPPTVTASGNTVTLTGSLRDNDLRYSAVFKVVNEGGTLSVNHDGKTIDVENANSVTIYFSAATDWRNHYPDDVTLGEEDNWRALMSSNMTYRTGETLEQLTARSTGVVTAASSKGWSNVYREHQEDYQEIFGRVKLDLGGTNTVPTNQALAEYRALVQALPNNGNGPAGATPTPRTKGLQHQMLETIQYQYGRYLLISSSRPGSLPANLQGIWNDVNSPPWSADYHMNINLQMNYWPAGAANLAETIEPLKDYVDALRITGRLTAQVYNYPADTPAGAWKTGEPGWTVNLGSTIWGLTTPGPGWSWGWHPAGNAFIGQNLYQYLQYGGDKAKFEKEFWPIIREAAVMWTKALYMSTEGPWAGKYVVLPSYSPEYGPLTVATAYDQQLVWELFTLTLSCMNQLGINDPAFRTEILAKRDNLYSPVSIGSPLNNNSSNTPNVIQEWPGTASTRIPDMGAQRSHRHMSHLIGFYPGTSIANGNPQYMEAAVNSLIQRGLGATGWSQGWKINLWARSLDKDRTYQMVNQMFRTNVAPNLFGLHDVRFQIDGNFGYAAGIHEILMQSHLNSIDLLPTLPSVWDKGSITGLRTIGGHTLNMEWENNQLQTATIKAHSTGNIIVRNEHFSAGRVKVNGAATQVTNGAINLNATAGQEYVITLSN